MSHKLHTDSEHVGEWQVGAAQPVACGTACKHAYHHKLFHHSNKINTQIELRNSSGDTKWLVYGAETNVHLNHINGGKLSRNLYIEHGTRFEYRSLNADVLVLEAAILAVHALSPLPIAANFPVTHNNACGDGNGGDGMFAEIE